MTKQPLGLSELEAHLDEQLGFLERSSDAYDAGFVGEAKRLALTLRLLLHHTGRSHALLEQLGRLNQDFVNTADEIPADSLVSDAALTVMGGGDTYIAPLDSGAPPDNLSLPFDDWWSAIVIAGGGQKPFTRRDLVLICANQDGGGHVDPALNSDYAALKSQSIGWTYESEGQPSAILKVEAASIRQIAHEVLKTFKPGYVKRSF